MQAASHVENNIVQGSYSCLRFLEDATAGLQEWPRKAPSDSCFATGGPF